MNTSGRAGASVALVVGALGFTGADLIRRTVIPSNGGVDAAAVASQAQAHAGPWLLAGFAMLLGSMAMLPGVAGVAAAVAGRGRGTARLGALLLSVGLVASVGHALAFYGLAGIGASSGVSAGAFRAVDAESNRYPLFVLVIVLFAVGTVVGSVLLAVGLRRAGVVPVWVPVAAIVFAVSGALSGVVSGVVGVLAALATFIPMARLLLPSGRGAAAVEPGGVVTRA